jgi:hypothetical protein
VPRQDLDPSGHRAFRRALAASGLSIYDSLDARPDLFLSVEDLERALNEQLAGLVLAAPIRTRAKIAKAAICEALGYPVPKSFRKTQPRFLGQDLDVYVQKSDNLQVWNEEISPTRRYAFLRVDDAGKVVSVRVVTGEAIAALDRTGKLTRKFQAKRRPLRVGSRLVSPFDTEHLQRLLRPSGDIPSSTLEATSASGRPTPGTLLSIQAIFDRLKVLEGMRLEDPGHDQDRVRGELLQREVAKALGLGPYVNRGQWPDILSQALEIKLQTASTIDLGLVLPSSSAPAREVGEDVRHCDIRYAVVYGHSVGATGIVLTEIVVVTGQDFFTEFQQFAGLVENAKLQIPLPRTFFRQSE